jgi:serine/threonine protein kinase
MWLFGYSSGESVGEYNLGPTLGRGSFGVVKEATKLTTGEKFAVKIVSAEKNDEKLALEIENQERLHHEHVVEIAEVIKKDGDTYIVMEHVPGGELFDYIVNNVRMSETEARRIFQQIIAGLEHCHLNKVAHRDLKPENILLDEARNVKICDFGFSARMQEGVPLTVKCGTPNYVAPEMLAENCQYEGPAVDIWSSGVILYALLCQELPFDADNNMDLFSLIKRGQYSAPGFMSNEAKDLVAKMLNVDPRQRISIAGIKDHPWFTKDLPPDLFLSCTAEDHVQNEKSNAHTEEGSECQQLQKTVQSLLEFTLVPLLSTTSLAVFPVGRAKLKSVVSLAVSPLCVNAP